MELRSPLRLGRIGPDDSHNLAAAACLGLQPPKLFIPGESVHVCLSTCLGAELEA